MTATKRLLCAAAALMAMTFVSSSARADGWVNGWWTYPYTYATNQTIHHRPWAADDKGLMICDTRIADTPIDNKGIAIGATRFPDGSSWGYRWIAIWHCEIANIWRSGPGIHQDFLQIAGGGDSQDVPTTVLLQDLDIHDGDGMPVILQDGIFDKITLRDVRVRNTTVSIQLVAINSGHIGTIVIDHCPNISIGIMGRPGSIGTVYVKNSPGLRVGDCMTSKGKSGANIVYLD